MDDRVQFLKSRCVETRRSFEMIRKLSNWTAEVYGFGVHLRQYGYYPKWLPLCVCTDHAPNVCGEPFKHELESDVPAMLYHHPDRVLQWKTKSKMPCYCYYSPFVFYRRSNSIHMSDDATGTIVFPAHGTRALIDKGNIDDYIAQLKSLPDQFQPVSICLHQNEVLNGACEKYIAAGFDVFTAGNPHDDRFTERFYEILKNFKFSTSNVIGSYTYYAVEMGMPFFLFGAEPLWVNEGDENIPKGEYTAYKKYDLFQAAQEMFARPEPAVTDEQMQFVCRLLGLNDGVSRAKMARILYGALIKYLLSMKFITSRLSKRN